MNYKKNTNSRSPEKQQEKNIVLKNLYNFFGGRENIFHVFEKKIFYRKSKGASFLNLDHSKLKVLTLNKCFKDQQ